jgi:glycyl-tRNA synthetase
VALTALYLLEVGVHEDKLRFRQHGSDEMAHYAADCWDAEADTSFGWIELVGIADRTCFDLDAHTDHSGQKLKAFLRYDEPKEFRVRRVVAHAKVLGPLFKKDAKAVKEALEALDPDEVEGKDKVTVTVDGKELEVPKEGFEIMWREIKESGEYITPHVIEPSYGIDRILYALLEHAYMETEKEGERYTVLRLRPTVAPIKVGVFPLMPRDGLSEIARGIDDALRARGIRTYFDEGGTVGKRYARMDDIGTPWCVTVDYDSKKDNKVTIRDRDSTEQVRVDIDDVPEAICRLLEGAEHKDL